MSRAAAFFDLDKTLIDADAGVLFGSHLLQLARIERDQAQGLRKWRLRAQYAAFMGEVLAKAVWVRTGYGLRLVKRSRVVRTAYTFFRDHPVEDFERALATFFEEELVRRVYPEVERVLEWHREQGHATVLITTGMVPIAKRYAERLGIDHVVACELVRDPSGRRLTGRVTGPLYGADKADHAERLAVEHGWDLEASYAYTDHYSDLHLLERVGNPRPVHPDKRLAKVAAQRGWPVLDFTDADRALAGAG